MSPYMSFKKWLSYFKGVSLPIGDLAADVAADKEFPDTDDFKTLDAYFSHKADARVYDVFGECYAFYKASVLDA